MLEFLRELVFHARELLRGEGGEVDCGGCGRVVSWGGWWIREMGGGGGGVDGYLFVIVGGVGEPWGGRAFWWMDGGGGKADYGIWFGVLVICDVPMKRLTLG